MGARILFWTVIALVVLGLSLPPALREKSWKRFFVAAAVSMVGILFPLFIFVMSQFLVPDWKGGCRYGWLDCFHVGKLALLPLVLWASAAFYMVQVVHTQNRNRSWIVLGIFMGAIISSICFAVGILVHAFQDEMQWWLLVPLYVTLWYGTLCKKVIRDSDRNLTAYGITLLGSLPFWAASIFWSKKYYLSLPDVAPDCFVVTAALRGHEAVVGPLTTVERGGKMRNVNRQLLTFWQLEALWKVQSPTTHRVFRCVYNRLGPFVSDRIRSRLAADIVYLLITPVEFIASFLIRYHSDQTKKKG